MDISAVTRKFKNEFESISDWLKFGFHGTDYNTFLNKIAPADFQKEYEKTIQAITAFAGENSLCKTVRLHGYRGSTEVLKIFSDEYGIKGVFCADDDRISYDLTPSENESVNNNFIYRKNNLNYYKTNLRYEHLSSAPDVIKRLEGLKDKERLVLFTHDSVFMDNLSKLTASLEWLNRNNYKFDFFDKESG
jgi:hypothetical protein